METLVIIMAAIGIILMFGYMVVQFSQEKIKKSI